MPMPHPSPPDALIQFVLQHMRIKTNVCTRQSRNNGYTLELRTVHDYNLLFSLRGRFVWVIDGEKTVFNTGELLIMQPGIIHHGYSTTKRADLLSLHVEATLPGGQDVFELLVPPRVQTVARTSRLSQYLHQAADEFKRDDRAAYMRMLRSWCRLISLELITFDAASGLLQHREMDPLIIELLDELDDRLDRPTTLNELADHAGFTPQHLNRVFRNVLGVTPLQYLAHRRMEYAAELLTEGKLTVKAVAQRVSFDDPYYFSRLFKQHFGKSPAEYRDAASDSDSPS